MKTIDLTQLELPQWFIIEKHTQNDLCNFVANLVRLLLCIYKFEYISGGMFFVLFY